MNKENRLGASLEATVTALAGAASYMLATGETIKAEHLPGAEDEWKDISFEDESAGALKASVSAYTKNGVKISAQAMYDSKHPGPFVENEEMPYKNQIVDEVRRTRGAVGKNPDSGLSIQFSGLAQSKGNSEEFVMVGISYKNAQAQLREKAAFTKSEISGITRSLRRKGYEIVILSTCNRSEIYLYGDQANEEAINIYRKKDSHLTEHLYAKCGKEAIAHLIWVCAGFDSMVQGEDQILGQVKDTWEFEKDENGTGKVLNYIFREAVHFAKQIKKEQNLEGVPRSLAATAVKEILKDYPRARRVLLIGAGNFGEVTLKYLAQSGFQEIYLTSRRCHSEERFKKIFSDLKIIPYEERYEKMNEVDVVISATAAPHLVLKSEKMLEPDHSLLICDLALPRDVDPFIGEKKNITLLNLDHYQEILGAGDSTVKKAEENLKPLVSALTEKMAAHIELLYQDNLKAAFTAPVYRQMKATEAMIDQMSDLTASQKKRVKKRIRSGFKGLLKGPVAMAEKFTQDQAKEVLSSIQALSSEEN